LTKTNKGLVQEGGQVAFQKPVREKEGKAKRCEFAHGGGVRKNPTLHTPSQL